MTSQEALSLFGSEISAKYFDGTGYTDITFYYQTTWANGFNNYGSVESEDSSLSMYKNQPYLVYTASATGVNYSNSYVTVDIRPEYSIFDTTQIHSCIALSCGDASQYVSSAAYNSPSWDWYWNGSRVHTENSALSSSGSGTYAVLKNVFTNSSISSFTFVPINLTSSAKSSGYSVQASFWGNRTFYNKYCLCIMLPYVDTDSSGSNGTFTTVTTGSSGGGGDINITVDVNLDDTNSKLDGIAGIVSDVLSALDGDENSYPENFSATVPTYPITFDDSVIDDGLTALDDVPDELAAGGFWFKLIYDIMHGSPLWLLLPLLIVLALARWVIWKG